MQTLFDTARFTVNSYGTQPTILVTDKKTNRVTVADDDSAVQLCAASSDTIDAAILRMQGRHLGATKDMGLALQEMSEPHLNRLFLRIKRYVYQGVDADLITPESDAAALKAERARRAVGARA